MRPLLFAANWKMHIGPAEARRYLARWLATPAAAGPQPVAFFPPAVSLEAVAQTLAGHPRARAGAQDVHWEPKGAYTGAVSVPLAAEAGAALALVGHSERRHVFGETDGETQRKVRAVLAGGLEPVLCVGEKLEEREGDRTEAVVLRQLRAALDGLGPEELDRVIVAYEPVWAIGTGRNATPADAALVHRVIRADLQALGAGVTRVLYGGSVNLANAASLLAEDQLDGVLVGGASLDPDGWAALVALGA